MPLTWTPRPPSRKAQLMYGARLSTRLADPAHLRGPLPPAQQQAPTVDSPESRALRSGRSTVWLLTQEPDRLTAALPRRLQADEGGVGARVGLTELEPGSCDSRTGQCKLPRVAYVRACRRARACACQRVCRRGWRGRSGGRTFMADSCRSKATRMRTASSGGNPGVVTCTRAPPQVPPGPTARRSHVELLPE